MSEGEPNNFLASTSENGDFNQYWYSAKTIKAIVTEIEACGAKRIAFLSTPSLYFSLTNEELKKSSYLFDYDETWRTCQHYVKYDFKDIDTIPSGLRHTFDMVVADPPFITHDVWSKYAEAIDLLLIPKSSADESASSSSSTSVRNILVTSIAENAPFFLEHFGATPVKFRPSIPHLVYQYDIFTNFPPTSALHLPNPEIPDDW